GNDFVVINNMDLNLRLSKQKIKELCTPHFGIGADGLILVEASECCDIRMNYFNKDGSVAEMCGNGVRCLAKYAADHELIDVSVPFSVETRAGKIVAEIVDTSKECSVIRVSMGKVSFDTKDLPVLTDKAELIGEKIHYNHEE
ncbi:MAG: diaminopimelate epimerase, partial [Eubacterium sp.]